MEYVLNVNKIEKVYKEFTLKDISFDLPKGSIMGIIGPNGAGKTTVIKIIMNLVKATFGGVEIFGLNYRGNEKEIKNRIGYVGEEQYFYQNKSVRWTEKFVSAFYQNWDGEMFNRLLDDFQLSRTKKIKELSKGMKVKLSFAIALSHRPELLILDEPTSGLDPVVRREILDLLLEKCQTQDVSVLISSHITDDIARIADYISFMVGGEMIVSGEKDDLLANWKKIHFKDGGLTAKIEEKLVNLARQTFGSSGITAEYPELKPLLKEGMVAELIKVENINLDDILISLVKEK